MSEGPLSDAAMDEMFHRLEEQIGRNPHCLCTKGDHGHPAGKCPTRASVVIKLHMAGNCRRARLGRPDLVDEDGNGMQVICARCWEFTQLYVRTMIRLSWISLDAIAVKSGTPIQTPTCECGMELVDPDRITWKVEDLPDEDS
jgi:hypothetical protein